MIDDQTDDTPGTSIGRVKTPRTPKGQLSLALYAALGIPVPDPRKGPVEVECRGLIFDGHKIHRPKKLGASKTRKRRLGR